MADHLAKLAELRSLPPELHWFCDTYASSAQDPPRIKSEHPSEEDLELRREQLCNCLQLFAYDDALQFQDDLARDLDRQLSRCDLCIIGYYKSRQHLIERLRHDYDEEEVAELVNIFNARDFTRIKRGLDTATIRLRKAEPTSRSKDTLDLPSQMALFEALSSEAFLADETLLCEHFQEPFKLVQTNRRLKLVHYVPAATVFLFDSDYDRWTWATNAWSKYSTTPSESDFYYAIRQPLLGIMQQGSEGIMDQSTPQRLWHGIGLIVKKLDNNLVTHSLRAMEIDVFRLALEHLKYDNDGLRFLVQTICTLLELAPKDFWDSMGTISPTTFIEQIFNNRQYDRYIEQAQESEKYESSALNDMLSWIKPFMASLETVHQARACRSLAFQLLDRLQTDCFPLYARLECKRIGLATLAWTLSNCSKEGAILSHTGRVTAAETLEVASDYIKDIVNIPSLPADDEAQRTCADTCLKIIRTALALECKSLRTDQEALRQNKELPDGHTSYSPAIWDAVVQHLDRGNLAVAKAALVGINDLTGLEKFRVNTDDPHTKEKSGFNVKLGRLTHLVCQILERINDFRPSDLDKLFRTSDTATALVASLFSPDASLYEAGVNLIKTISSESARKEAVGHLLQTFLGTTLNAFSWAIRRIARNRAFAACPRMLKTSADVLDILCDSQYGLLRTRKLFSVAEIKAVENFWEHQWEGLRVIYEMTENWGRTKVADGHVLKEFCRDTMQFSERFFDQYSVFATATSSVVPIKQEEEDPAGRAHSNEAGKELLEHPAKVMEAMVKWLRLRDAFLIEISVNLTKKVLNRLTELGMTVAPGPRDFLEQVLINGSQAKSNLQPQEKAELARALEANLGFSILATGLDQEEHRLLSDRSREQSSATNKKLKASTIDLATWKANARSSNKVIEVSDDEFADSDLNDRDLLSISRSAELMKDMEKSIAQRDRMLPSRESKSLDTRERKHSILTARESKTAKPIRASVSTDTERALFREKREKEREAKKKRDAETLAMVKKKAGLSGSALGEGSGLTGIGVKGKDHAPKGQSMMVSSGSESESEDELDKELFGNAPKATKSLNDDRFFRPSHALPAQTKGPIKKLRQARSAKDMRARLAPDLTALHKTILGWDFFHDGDFPPGSNRDNYSLVTNTFRNPIDYQNTFEPLLVLEAWQGFLKSKEEGNLKTFEIKVANRMNVDAFLELSTTMPMTEAKELGISEADIVLMSKGQSPSMEVQQPHCLARVWKATRKKATMEITYRVNVGNGLVASMVPNATLFAARISSMTPLEREYGALLGLKYFDLCDEIIRAKPSPILEYSAKQLGPLLTNYNINIAQAKAVKSAVDNDAFTLIQGPPGSGKTKTIVAIVGALLTGSFVEKGVPIARPHLSSTQQPGHSSVTKKLLVCAPSNAAVDELVMRFKEGVKTADGTLQKLSVIRLGRSDAINANVLDVTLDELVNAKLNLASGKKNSAGDDIHQIMMAHKATSEELTTVRTQMDELKASGMPVSPDQDRHLEVLKRKKQQLSNQIDAARDHGDVAARDAELSKRRIQQDLLNGAHVICATLSGSGHDMFQNLNIEFETVVIDEAAQSIELSALIPLKYGCSKCIMVGDPKQLPPTVLSREAARFQYEQSLFVRMQGNHPNDVHLLDTQYRMHPEISTFPSNAFYDARLLDGPGMAKLRSRPWHESRILGPYRFFDVQGHHQSAPRGHSLINLAEIHVALKLFDRLITDCRGYDFKGKVGIITPYKSQLRELRSRFAQKYGDSVFATVEFNTTDAFQGRESEIIIFSCVRASVSKGIGFLSDIRRMNVGITRAKSSLWVLGNSQSLMQGEYWGRLVQDAKSRDRYTNGDLDALLGNPLLTLDSTTMAAMNKPSPSMSTSSNSSRDIDMPEAPILRSLTTTNTSGSSTVVESAYEGKSEDEEKATAYYPAGGTNGLNPNANCQRCGSFAHYTYHCTNPDARVYGGGQCFRCDRDGHSKASCLTERCLICGEFGHLQRTCTSNKPLSSKDKLRISKQEAEHKSYLQRVPDLQRKRQLGNHDNKVPVVIATSGAPPLGKSEQKTGEKRRRGSSPSATALRESKIRKDVREASGSMRKEGVTPPSNGNQLLSKFPNENLTGERVGSSAPKLVPSRHDNRTSYVNGPNGPNGPNDLATLADSRHVSKPKENFRGSALPTKPLSLPPKPPISSSTLNRSMGPLTSPRHDGGYASSRGLDSSMSMSQAKGIRDRQTEMYRPGNKLAGESARHTNEASTNIKADDGPKGYAPSRLPPRPPDMVRPPKKRKEVDPFIKPRRRP